MNHPFGVVKTRVQVASAAAVSGHALGKAYKERSANVITVLTTLVREEGPLALHHLLPQPERMSEVQGTAGYALRERWSPAQCSSVRTRMPIL